jgi:hypothetical protein
MGHHSHQILSTLAFLDGFGLPPGHRQQITIGYMTLDSKPTLSVKQEGIIFVVVFGPKDQTAAPGGSICLDKGQVEAGVDVIRSRLAG